MTTMEQAKRRTETISGVTNVAYDLMVILTNKLEGIGAIEEYKIDAEEANDTAVLTLFSRLEQRMREDVGEIRRLLIARMGPKIVT